MSQLSAKQFLEISSKLIYKNRIFRLDSSKIKVKGQKRTFEHQVIRHPGAAVIVPLLDRNHVVLIRQFRTALKRVVWEFPAGTLEKGEAPLRCAKREIIEEIGYEAKRWKKLALFYPAPGISSEVMHLYLASRLEPRQIDHDTDEYLESKVVSLKQLRKMVLAGTIDDAKTILGFFYLMSDRNHSR